MLKFDHVAWKLFISKGFLWNVFFINVFIYNCSFKSCSWTLSTDRSFLTCKQYPGQSPSLYLDDLRGRAVTFTQQGGTIVVNHNLISDKDVRGNELSDDERRAKAYDKTLAFALITRSDPTKSGPSSLTF